MADSGLLRLVSSLCHWCAAKENAIYSRATGITWVRVEELPFTRRVA